MNYVIRVLSTGQNYIFVLLALLIFSACSTTPQPQASLESFSNIASVDIETSDSQSSLEAIYGGKVIVYKPESGFAILGFTEDQAKLTTLTTDPNIDALESPEFSALGNNAWGAK